MKNAVLSLVPFVLLAIPSAASAGLLGHDLSTTLPDSPGQELATASAASSSRALASADSPDHELHDVPSEQEDEFGKRVFEKVVGATNGFFANHVDRLSHRWVVIRFDGLQQRAKVAVGAGLGGYRLRVASDVTVVDGTARVTPRLALAVAGKSLDLRLPTVDVAATEFRGERGVEVRLPVIRRTF